MDWFKKRCVGLLRVCTIGSFIESFASYFKEPIKYASLNNQPCQALILVGINSNETLFYLFTVSGNKCGGSCNTIDDPYAQVGVPNKVKIWMQKFLMKHEIIWL